MTNVSLLTIGSPTGSPHAQSIQQEQEQDQALLEPATLAIDDDQSDTQSTTLSIQPKSMTTDPDSLLGQGLNTTLGWYPTLQKTMWILIKLYRCVQVRIDGANRCVNLTRYLQKTGVFEDLAQEAVSLCIESLKRASETMATTKVRPSETWYACPLSYHILSFLVVPPRWAVIPHQATGDTQGTADSIRSQSCTC